MLPDTNQSHFDNCRTGRAEPVPQQAAIVRFVFVNGRTPRGNAHCAQCCEAIGEGYVRDVATGLLYCDRHGSAERSRRSGLASRFRAWVVS